MIIFIDDHQGKHRIEPICDVLPITPATYFDHLTKSDTIPALVVGRTLITGAVPGDMIAQVVRDEQALSGPACPIG